MASQEEYSKDSGKQFMSKSLLDKLEQEGFDVKSPAGTWDRTYTLNSNELIKIMNDPTLSEKERGEALENSVVKSCQEHANEGMEAAAENSLKQFGIL